jgi:hypothetical protein
MYHIELYAAKNGNISYVVKVLGSPTTPCDKFIFGWLIGGIIIFLLIGPIYLFSEYSGFIAPNPVWGGNIEIDMSISKNISMAELMSQNKGEGLAHAGKTNDGPQAQSFNLNQFYSTNDTIVNLYEDDESDK